jgi:general secretion pathway protein A
VIPFGHNSSNLADETFSKLDQLAAALAHHPAAKISIRGYTDASGVYSYNLNLSEFRAQMVKSYLVGKGVPSERISAEGMGSQNPIDTGNPLQDKLNSRRVEIKIQR